MTAVAVALGIGVPYPEVLAMLVGGAPLWITLIICALVAIVCPAIALARWLRPGARMSFEPPSG